MGERGVWRRAAITGTGLAVLLAFSPAAGAGETPATALKRAVRALAKQKSFRATLECQGGLSDKPTRLKCSKRLVRRDYDAAVFRPVMKIESPQAFVLYGTHKGAIHKGMWRGLLSTKKGREIPKLFRAPEIVLATAARYAKKTGVWLPDGVDTKTWKRQKPGKAGATVSRAEAEEGETRVPTRLRVFGPATVATKLITEVQNSGCLDGG